MLRSYDGNFTRGRSSLDLFCYLFGNPIVLGDIAYKLDAFHCAMCLQFRVNRNECLFHDANPWIAVEAKRNCFGKGMRRRHNIGVRTPILGQRHRFYIPVHIVKTQHVGMVCPLERKDRLIVVTDG